MKIKKLTKVILALLLATVLFSCSVPAKINDLHRRQKYQPRAMRTQIFSGMPLGGDSYSEGVRDGCDNAVSEIGAAFYRLVKPKFDADRMISDPWYLRGIQDGMTFCTFRLDWETH